MADDDRKSISQFVQEMKYLKQEALKEAEGARKRKAQGSVRRKES